MDVEKAVFDAGLVDEAVSAVPAPAGEQRDFSAAEIATGSEFLFITIEGFQELGRVHAVGVGGGGVWR